ncbi:hypothetical protein B296_00030271 [Ensete ventricosum]|uniref:Uncharacterized protein n=1 Tax=Ensete ventricosum TaxID=4639 RepID=A0A427AJ53_ENSVE|nr:hypothetical protein B296_00030271 [Ensete ventricosum]
MGSMYRYVNRPLPGGTTDWGCIRPVTTRNRLVRSISIVSGRIRAVLAEGRRKKKMEKENLGTTLLFARAICRSRVISSPRTRRRNKATLPFFF